jgi:Lipocalin-like domain
MDKNDALPGSILAREAIVGVWHLVEWQIKYFDGRAPTLPFGIGPVGLLLYDASGWMTATMSARQRTPLSAASARSADSESCAKALDEYLSYTALWWIEGAEIVHRVITSLNPVLMGTDQRRRAWPNGKSLVLEADEPSLPAAPKRSHHIEWSRERAM